MEKGLYKKYTIINNETGEEVTDECFVLIPKNDLVARIALKAYADATENKQLETDLRLMADYEFVPCNCRGLADCNHINGGYFKNR